MIQLEKKYLETANLLHLKMGYPNLPQLWKNI